MTPPRPLSGLRFPFTFDPQMLRTDLAQIQPHEWKAHYNERDFGGHWSGVALRSASGLSSDLIAAPPAPDAVFQDTPVLARCPYLGFVLSRFGCPLRSVRLLSLAPASFIREHSDNALGYEDGEVRIHIPIATNPDVEFYVCGERLLLTEGNCYYVNVNLPHRVNNRGRAARVHLVIDAEVNEWVRNFFGPEALPIERSGAPPGSMESFRRFVLGRPALMAELGACADRREFSDRLVALGKQHGFDFHEGDVDAGFRSDPTVLEHAPDGWAPVEMRGSDACWLCLPEHRFREPFFGDSVRVGLRNPFTSLFRVTAPLPLPRAGDARRPSGLIFHMSRCGSTLVSRSLAMLPRAHVISEAPPLDQVLQSALPRGEKIEALRALVHALGRDTDRYFLKLDAWHIQSLPLLRDAFPTTPWIFLYRDPGEVLVSHLRIPGHQTLPGVMDPAVLGLTAEDAATLTRTEWCVRVIGNFCRKALEFREDSAGLFVDYKRLPRAIAGEIAAHFRLSLSADEEKTMLEAAGADAKNPALSFEPDTAAKQEAFGALRADPALADFAELYRRLLEGQNQRPISSALPCMA